MVSTASWTRPWSMIDRGRSAWLADWLVVALAVSLPWSTTATGILAVLWLIAIIPTLDVTAMRRVLLTPAGGIPVLFWGLALAGMLWAFDVSLAERWAGLKPIHRLLAIPLLIAQFHRSENAKRVLIGFVISCGVLLVLSWIAVADPRLPRLWAGREWSIGIPVKDYIAQSGEFTFCIFILAALALTAWHEQRRRHAIAALLLALAFLVNVLYVTNSRTALVILPILLLLFACKHLNWKGVVVLLSAGAVAGVLVLVFVPAVHGNVASLMQELRTYQPQGERTRAGERLEFWRKSIGFIADAPLIGHGTGSIRDQFRRSVVGETGVAAVASSNPHNQTFAVAIQLGLLGTMVLFAMWIAHLSMFRGYGLAAWAGLVVVTQNIVSSLFNSHLFDFTQGWSYIVGVGVAAGVVLKSRNASGPAGPQRPRPG